ACAGRGGAGGGGAGGGGGGGCPWGWGGGGGGGGGARPSGSWPIESRRLDRSAHRSYRCAALSSDAPFTPPWGGTHMRKWIGSGLLVTVLALLPARAPAQRRPAAEAGPRNELGVRSEEHTSELQSRFDL